jgi:hypothetical protein
MKYTIEMTSGGIICVPSSMTIGLGIQVILRLLPQNLRGYDIGITGGRDLCSALLRWPYVDLYTNQVSYRLLQVFKQYWGLASAT